MNKKEELTYKEYNDCTIKEQLLIANRTLFLKNFNVSRYMYTFDKNTVKFKTKI